MIATFLIWIMLILGGSGNNRGAILGAAVVWIIWSMTEMLADLLPTELAIQAKYVRMFLIGLMLQLVLRFRPEGLLPEDPASHHEIAAAAKTGAGGSCTLPPTRGPCTTLSGPT